MNKRFMVEEPAMNPAPHRYATSPHANWSCFEVVLGRSNGGLGNHFAEVFARFKEIGRQLSDCIAQTRQCSSRFGAQPVVRHRMDMIWRKYPTARACLDAQEPAYFCLLVVSRTFEYQLRQESGNWAKTGSDQQANLV